jgi:hypothetical protein
MAPGSEADPTPPPGYVVSFTPFHERGFGMPACRFMRALPHYYGVELHNFNPNSIAQAAIFMAVCKEFLGIDPHWDLWTNLFSMEFFATSTDVKKVRMVVRAGSTVHPHLPCVFEQGVAKLVVLSPERRRDASAVFSTSGDRRR